ncbi:YaaA family protein [Polymorphospora sp. NPDC050346]|uniref:YaaA family protein n=1 Tax=Polymorphospora sp. NPDC050346 TaxID=3155780 RepID=UPI00340F4EEE
MMILIHSSKAMRAAPRDGMPLGTPALVDRAEELAGYLKTLPPARLAEVMQLSESLAEKTHEVIAGWDAVPEHQSPAVHSFIGDIYSGLRIGDLSEADREYADERLRILSGLYGILRPYDGIRPYRLEMGYKLPGPKYGSLYDFWGDAVARCVPATGLIVNLAAVEYSRTVTSYVDAARLVTPKFLTVDPKSGEPKFVTVHAKIARGAFARWLVTRRVDAAAGIEEFDEIGYRFDAGASRPGQPVFVCEEFGGKGLSVRLQP